MNLRRLGRTTVGMLTRSVAAGIALLASGAPVTAQSVTGEATAEFRLFPESPLFLDQRDEHVFGSFSVEPELAWDWDEGRYQFTFRPFARLDSHDDGRSHADIRELTIRRLGDAWTLSAGFDRVFWGVTEVNHLIDVVNQTDAVEDLDGEDKLGQPMVNVTVEGGWGALDAYWLPYFRERTFPDARGRLRGPFPVGSSAAYEASAGQWHQDFALRWSYVWGAFDVGASFFRGTGREPTLVPEGPLMDPSGSPPADPSGLLMANPDGGLRADPTRNLMAAPTGSLMGTPNGGSFGLRPYYSVIDQTAVDVQWTGDASLLKLEAMTRAGHGGRFFALTGGVEYTLYQVGEGASDLGLLAEVMIDGRDDEAPPTLFDHDVFGGFRWALNDPQDSSVLGGIVVDYETGESFALLEAERRIGGDWKLELQGRFLANTDPRSTAALFSRDSYLTLRLGRFW